MLERYIPTTYKVENDIVVYQDQDGRLKAFFYGEQIDVSDSSNLRKYSILGALTLYLDFINLFLMLLRLFGNRN